MSDGYLSRDKAHLARQQRERRAGMVRIDYMPSREALAAFEARRGREVPGSVAATNSAVLDAILGEWAELAGIDCRGVDRPKSPVAVPGIKTPNAGARAGAYESGPHGRRHSRGDIEGAYESGGSSPDSVAQPARLPAGPLHPKIATRRVTCGARRHRDGQPCQAKNEPGKRRCRFHGGRSTGPRTPEGKARALANLRQYRKP